MTTEELEEERKHLRTVFQKNGYPEKLIEKGLQKATKTHNTREDRENEGEDRRRPLCILPYIRRMAERLARICTRKGARPVFRHMATLRTVLTHVKGKHRNADKGIVYQIPCGDCEKSYIGETGRPFIVRMNEHRCAVKTEDMRNANAVHSIKESHSIAWENARIIDREQNWKKRRIKESLYIRNKDNYNLDSGLALSHVWDPLIGQASCMF